jgi:pyruvate/2-oxoglutarate dehydrogenase complex dihydrolipoamide acyltransferase (E2) component
LSKPTRRWSEINSEKPVNEMRVKLYERLMEAQEQIAQARYPRGVTHELVLGALDAAEAGLSDAERREDLYVSSLAAYVEALGGHVEINAVFDDDTIVVRRDPL